MQTTSEQRHTTIDHLNSFLRGELSACETYRQALMKITEAPMTTTLATALRSHEARVGALRGKIRALGGEPAETSGPWGAFVTVIEAGAKLFGVKAAIAALEEGEDHGKADYDRDLDKLDPEARTFVLTQLMPAQRETHRIVSGLKHSLH